MKLQHNTLRNILMVCVLCACFSTRAFTMEDAILAVVNDEVITHNDLRDYLSSMYVQLAAQGRSKEEMDRIMVNLEVKGINRLIEDKLIISEAENLEMIIREEAINKRIEDIKSNYANEQDFLNALIANGSTITDVREKIREQMQVQYVIEAKVKSKIVVNPQEVTRYYENNSDEFKKSEQVKVDSIAISYNQNKEMAVLKAQEALSLIKKGEDFLKVAERFSQLPSIGVAERGQMIESVEEILFNLKEGEVSPLVETEIGVFIFRVNEKVPAKNASLEEAKDFITDKLFQQKFKARYRKWIDKLKDQAYVEIKK